MNFRIILTLLLVTIYSSSVSAQDDERVPPAFSVDAEFGRYFFNQSSYQTLHFSTKSQFMYGLKFTSLLGQQTSFIFSASYTSFNETHDILVPYGFSGGNFIQNFTIHKSVQSIYKEGLSMVGFSRHVPIGENTTIIPYGGFAIAYVSEQDGKSNISDEFVTPGFGAGAELELMRSQSPLSALIKLEFNYEHRGRNSLLRDYAGALLSLGLRYNFTRTTAAP